MASTGFKAIAQVAEILDRPEIDGTSRHFIVDLITKTLGENNHLKTSLDEKKRDYAQLHMTLTKRLQQANSMAAKTIRSLEEQLREKDCEIEDLQAKIQEKDEDAERALGENAEVIEQLEEEIKGLQDWLQQRGKQIHQNHQLIENHEASIEYLQEQVKEKDKELEEIKRDHVYPT